MFPRVELLEERPAVSERRQRRNEKSRNVKWRMTELKKGLVVKTVTNKIITSLGQCDDRFTAGVCTFRVIDRGKNEAHSQMEVSRDHEHLELFWMVPTQCPENRESRTCGFSKDQWLNNDGKLVNEVTASNVQALMVVESDREVKFDQETSIADVKFTRQGKSCGELHSVGGSSNVPKESPMSASAVNALMEKSVREMQITVKTMVPRWCTVLRLKPGGAISTWTVEIVGHVVGKSQSSVADVKTACERRMRKSCRTALVKFDELVMLMTIVKLGCKVVANTIILNLVDRSDEVVPTTDRVVKVRIVHRVPKEQRDSARDTRSVRGVPWQQTSAEMSGGKLRARVRDLWSSTFRWDGSIGREVGLAKCGFSKDCEGCSVATSGDEVSRFHGDECRERIRVAMMGDDAGQQRLRTTEERLAPADRKS